MASKKQFDIAFKIGAQIASSFGSAFKKANQSLNDMGKKTKDLKKNFDGLQSVAQKGLAFSAVGLGGLGYAAKQAMSAESAMAEFGKVLNGTQKQLDSFRDKFMKISSETGKSFQDVAQIAAAAAQSGIKQSDIEQFTKDAIRMSIAFDMTAEEAGQSMAELRVQFKLSQAAVVELGDKINYLGNTTPNTSKKITEVVQRVGSLANLANLASGDVAALGSSIVGMEPEVVATGLKHVIFTMTAGASATKNQVAAFAELGLTASQVSKAVQKDSVKAITAVLEAVKKLPKEKQASVLKDLFGAEGIGATSQLVDNLDNVKKNLAAVAEANKQAWQGSMLKEYETRSKTAELAVERAKQSFNNLVITIGYHLLPYIKQAADWFSTVAQRMNVWAKANPELAQKLLVIGGTIAAVIAGISALSLVVIAFLGPIRMAISVLKSFSFVINIISMVGKVFMWLSRIFLMNPIGLAITAIIVAIYLLWSNWDTVSKWIGGAWDWIKQKGLELLTWFQSLPSRFIEFGKNLLQGLANGIKSGVSAAVNAAGEAVEAVKNKVKNFFGINSPSKLFAQYGEWNMEGLAIGMQAGAPMAERASGQAMSSVLPTGQSLTSSNTSNTSSITIYQTINGDQNVADQAKQATNSAWDEIQSRNKRNKRTSFA